MSLRRVIAVLFLGCVLGKAQGHLVPRVAPIRHVTALKEEAQPTFHLAVGFWINNAGVRVTECIPTVIENQSSTYKMDYWLEYETSSGKTFRVRASNPTFGPTPTSGTSTAVVPTEEGAKAIRVYAPGGAFLGSQFFTAQEEPQFLVSPMPRGQSEHNFTPILNSGVREGAMDDGRGHFEVKGPWAVKDGVTPIVRYRISWDEGQTWTPIEAISPNDAHVRSSKDRIRIDSKGLEKQPHPLVELIHTLGPRVFRKVYRYEE